MEVGPYRNPKGVDSEVATSTPPTPNIREKIYAEGKEVHQPAIPTMEDQDPGTKRKCILMGISDDQVEPPRLPIVRVPAKDAQGERQDINILLDTGSTASFLTVSARYMLQPMVLERSLDLNVKHIGGAMK